MPEAPLYGTVSNVMSRNVVTVKPYTSIRAAARVMATNHVSGVPVVDDDGRLLGMVSEIDLLRSRTATAERESWWLNMLAEGEKMSPDYIEYVRTGNDMVRLVMQPDVTSVSEDTPLSEVARLIIEKGVKRLPVIADGRIVGIVSRADLVRALGARKNRDQV
jgi:CBS domain-containing protein